jgi:hypothetical protein
MREFLDGILIFIGSESLTDTEFNSIELTAADYNKETYEALKAVLENREDVSSQSKKLKMFFLSKGIDLYASLKPTPNSNIFIGTPL